MGAKAIGLNDFEIIVRYMLPNMSSTLIVQVTLSAAKAIIAEASLSFLGLGIQPPLASWGAMLKSRLFLFEPYALAECFFRASRSCCWCSD